ncbi:hypothetical protein BISA_1534 [Bifidobacterium saguini DSM 23967]|uniref:Uncharacterized protein n=1 Tax=Bifidobacterium saguini DSM 23967 TaxID=1437607 RepID=A0A087DD47_9BIFI|nr:hypothetical protein BISA_1534 [Bifidobacterium saguini DSM 23967]
MVTAPTLGIRHLHLIAQHIPDHARLFTGIQSFQHGHVRQFRHSLVSGKRPSITTAKHFFKEFPKFTFAHTRQCATTLQHLATRSSQPSLLP